VLDCAPGAELLAVGKRSGRAMANQAWINRALVAGAQRHPVVVRLKGGDPTVFGRLDEEIDALEASGIRWEIVPGVTAAAAAAAAAGVSLTRGGVARRVAIVTPRLGHGEDEQAALEWSRGLNPSGTVVLYMAGAMAGTCARVLLGREFDPATPVVVVRGASWREQSVERLSLATLAATGLSVDERPVVVLVGHALRWRTDLALAHQVLALPPSVGNVPEVLRISGARS